MSVLLVVQLFGQFLAGSVGALDPYHEHLILGADPQLARTALGWHQHSLVVPHSHPITGSVFEEPAGHRPQIISFVSNAATLLSSTFGVVVNEILAPSNGNPTVPLFLVLPLGLAALAFALSPGLAPPAPPPKPTLG